MKLRELIPFKYKVKEDVNTRPGVLCTVEGVFQRADVKNANGRIYPSKLWQGQLGKQEVVDRLKDRQMLGMLGHPADGQTDPEKVSHIITKQELRSDGTLFGEAEVLDTPNGRIIKTLFDAGVKLGISSRGDGSIEKEGGADIVQSDFRLETYDFVLKPSTPGAYPTVVENVEENERLVVEAIKGLVESDLTEKQRLPVMLECLKILSALDTTNNDLVQSLSKKITEQVSDPNRVIASVVAEEKQPQQESKNMSDKSNPTFDAASLAWHKDQVRSAQVAVATRANEEIKGLKDQLIKLQKESAAERRQLAAATSLIEDFRKKIKNVSESKVVASDKKLKRRYEAAVDLLDEAIKRLPEIGTLKRRNRALESLLQASITKFKSEAVQEAVAECLSKVPESLHEGVKKAFSTCRTPSQVQETFSAIQSLSTGRAPARKEPLPSGGKINEGKNKDKTKQSTSNVSESFSDRLSRKLSVI